MLTLQRNVEGILTPVQMGRQPQHPPQETCLSFYLTVMFNKHVIIIINNKNLPGANEWSSDWFVGVPSRWVGITASVDVVN